MLLAIDPMNWESWLPSWMTTASGTSFYLNLAYFGYNIFYVLSIILFVFKIGQAFYNYQRKASTSMDFQRTELANEIWEPVKGLAYLLVGMSVIQIVVSAFSWSTNISITDDASKMDEVINVFKTIGVWSSITRLINIFVNVFGIGMTCYCLFKALTQIISASKEDNPNQFSTKRTSAIQYLIYAVVASCSVVIINVVFNLLKIGNVFGGFKV